MTNITPYINIIQNEKNLLFHSSHYDSYNVFLKKLFDYSSLINHTNHLGETVLHHVCFYGMIDKFYALNNMGAEIKKTIDLNTLLHYACFSGKDNFLILELIKLNILPIEQNKFGETSLHLAANKQIASYLHLWCNRHKISIVDIVDNKGNTVLDTANNLNRTDVAQYWEHQYPALVKKNDHNNNIIK